ncbi:MAG: riboflavin biosynthesis protein RibF [Acidimicrobiia bacterium]|nr:riboflavin biosynthesis protein RibF [Acidimicrobiia bacterium]
MKVLRGPLDTWDAGVSSMVVTIGVYDGVHVGHHTVFDTMRSPADGLPLGVLTFDVHPVALLAPERVPPLLTSMEQKLEQFEAAGIDVVGIMTFDESLSSMRAEPFVTEIVYGAMAASHVVVGRDFRFGYQREGDLAVLEGMGMQLGFGVTGLELRAESGAAVSSSRIRGTIANGDVATAAELLGRPFALRGPVAASGGGARTGIRTAHVAVDHRMVQPAPGVYAARASVSGEQLSAAVNVGVRPTFGPGDREHVEVHLLDVDRELTGVPVDVAFIDRIRNEKRFHNEEELAMQIQKDIEVARRVLQS